MTGPRLADLVALDDAAFRALFAKSPVKRIGRDRFIRNVLYAIGNSADRPAALAELMGIIVNDGKRRSTLRVTQLSFADGTPYETVFEPAPDVGEQVLDPAVAQALRGALANVAWAEGLVVREPVVRASLFKLP